MLTQTILDFFANQSVKAAYAFLGEYAAENSLDELLKKKNEDLDSSELISKQLYEALDESLRLTCKHSRIMEYDANAIKETFSVNENPWISIDSKEKLGLILRSAIGESSYDSLSLDDIKYWFTAFNHAVATRQELYNYLHEQETTQNSIIPFLQRKLRNCEVSDIERVLKEFIYNESYMVGGLVANRYRIMKKLGIGGYGTVLLVHDCHLRRDAAMKVFFTNHELARNELDILNGLKHPGLPYIYDVLHLSDNKTALVMDFIKGNTLLKEAFLSHGLSVQRTLDITKQLCIIVSFLHNMNIIHGDIKPNNIMINDDKVVLIDYNLSQLANNSSLPLGRTDGYSPPEFYLDGEWEDVQKINGETMAFPIVYGDTYWLTKSSDRLNNIFSVNSDIYSIGATVFYTLTGEHPWPYKYAIRRMKDFEPEIFEILNGCLQIDPLNRFSSVQDILDIIGKGSQQQQLHG